MSVDWDEVKEIWDECPPSLEEFSESGNYSDLELVPQTPTIDLLPNCVDYSPRGPGDFVMSGPMGAGRGPGRYFDNRQDALNWCRLKYGYHRVFMVDGESEFRWAYLIKKESGK